VGIEPFHELRIAGKPTTEHIDFRSLDNHRMPDGGGFPGTYRNVSGLPTETGVTKISTG
jgi:hypothetical protein